jgi:superfamily II helicase
MYLQDVMQHTVGAELIRRKVEHCAYAIRILSRSIVEVGADIVVAQVEHGAYAIRILSRSIVEVGADIVVVDPVHACADPEQGLRR